MVVYTLQFCVVKITEVLSEYCLIEMCGNKTGNAMGFQMSKAMPQTAFQNVKKYGFNEKL